MPETWTDYRYSMDGACERDETTARLLAESYKGMERAVRNHNLSIGNPIRPSPGNRLFPRTHDDALP